MSNRQNRVFRSAPRVPVVARILGAVLTVMGTLANIAIKDLWRHHTASLPLTILLVPLLYGAIFFAQLQGVRMLVASTPEDLSFTPRMRVFGVGLVATFILVDVLVLVAAMLGLL